MIEIQGLTYTYPGAEQPALLDINLSIPKGQFCALVGANGAGKSTLCYAISGFVPHFFRGHLDGAVSLAGEPLASSSLGELSARVGMVFQNAFNQISGTRFTVREEIAFGLENLGLPRAEMAARIDEALELVELVEEAERSPYALSGGQQQRLAIASMLAMQPEVLVLDEPTSQLDPRGTQEVFAAIAALADRGVTIVLVEHKLEWLAAFADRALLLHAGRVVADGSPRTVLAAREMEDYGVGRTEFTRAAALLRERKLAASKAELPVTLEQAREFLA
jgi:energy-coupling factor transporter ATP-binding protein EcfA2